MHQYKITIATPTYNRAAYLDRLYQSIRNQTFRDFEWLIIDDGSTDNTKEVIQGFLADRNSFPISYHKKVNGGKSRAVNYALDLAKGELFFIMDSDDYLTPNALERIVYWESTIREKKDFCGVTGNRGISPTETPNLPLKGEYEDVSVLEKYSGNNALFGEHAEVFYTDIFRKFKYPEFEGEKYMTPCLTFDRMAAAGYRVRYFQDIIWICKYLDEGLTKNIQKIQLNNPYGTGLALQERLRFTKASFRQRFLNYYSFYCDMKVQYDYRQISDFVKVSPCLMKTIELIHKAKQTISSKKVPS